MHPITVIEILSALGLVLLLLGLIYFLPRKKRNIALRMIVVVIVIELGFFAIRPLWIDYHREIKTEQLTEYLEKRYPGEEFGISYRTSRSYNPYHLEVRFANERGWIYSYSVTKDEIKQVDIGVPDDELLDEGLHYEDLGD
ncbi:LPXTG cell wall anchor domain-containing protein [Mesobacillus subterraneus]|uniref:LPXTG cell wall anchor domain-containing protein n=1 Tax=Mesobacillus subterraneus TaxID=285983 RepID=UPI00273ED2AA|nr:LPXTG cell wall anchor domain-containing protein [Mesobacillus subterraneus]WLR54879.1 LPXTG cell wall anchor domain-containing protein [Mesobacillus subterraneus]